MGKYILFAVLAGITALSSCRKIDEFKQDPDVTPLRQGFQSSAAIGYCASLAAMAFNGEPLPPNVTYQGGNDPDYSGSGVLFVNVTDENPLPFNHKIGQIMIAGIWDNTRNGGVISILFGDINLLGSEFKFYGIHTVPVSERDGKFMTVFAEQDIVIGEGSDTILNVGMSRFYFDIEQDRLDTGPAEDVFVAAKQNVWFITFEQNDLEDVYDDAYQITGGGQMALASNQSGGIVYHALLKTQYNFSECTQNPIRGSGFIQNIQAGSSIDFGHLNMDFSSSCDGKAKVTVGTGKYLSANGRNINLNFN